MNRKTYRPKSPTCRLLTGQIAIRLVLLSVVISVLCGQSLAQSANQFGARPPAPAKTEIGRTAGLPVAPPADAPRNEAKASPEPSRDSVLADSDVVTSITAQTQFRIERLPEVYVDLADPEA